LSLKLKIDHRVNWQSVSCAVLFVLKIYGCPLLLIKKNNKFYTRVYRIAKVCDMNFDMALQMIKLTAKSRLDFSCIALEIVCISEINHVSIFVAIESKIM
jgi:hypothetical protein